MSADVKLAFAHPEARAAATASRPPLDRISLRDYVLEVEIGAFQAERGTTQKICFNVAVEVAPLDGPIEDDVDKILSYDRITEAIDAEIAAERLNLLETLADRVAERILREPQARRVFLRIEKLDRGPFVLGVEIVRSRVAAVDVAPVTDIPHPCVVFLSNAALGEVRLDVLIAKLDGEAPIVFCVDLPAEGAPQVGAAMPQRRIDLLAVEQNAWRLASRNDRCVVVGTRTELDWAMKHDQISVWAPSKLVLDAAQRPDATDPVDLAVWFAQEMSAAEFVAVGSSAPDIEGIPSRILDPRDL